MLAIDFGTTRTKVASIHNDIITILKMGYNDEPYIPSIFHLSKEGHILVGHNAVEMMTEDPSGIIPVLKRRLRETIIRKQRHRTTPTELLTLLFADIRLQVLQNFTHVDMEDIDTVCMTHPTSFTHIELNLLKDAALAADFTTVHFVAEPEAAARWWKRSSQNTISTSKLVVLDCGGGTVDWTCLSTQNGQFKTFSEIPSGGDDQLGGYDIDTELLGLLEDHLNDLEAFDAVEDLRGNPIPYLNRIRIIKERYSRHKGTLPKSQRRIKIRSTDFFLDEDKIEKAIESAFINNLSQHLESYLDLVRKYEPNPEILLIGGGAKVHGLKDALTSKLNIRVTVWSDSEFATVKGALVSEAYADIKENTSDNQAFILDRNPNSSQPNRSSGTIRQSLRLSDIDVSSLLMEVVEEVLMDVVAEKAGYPADALDLSMRLEGDLGIDFIELVEILSAVQERAPELPVMNQTQMAQLQTLGDIVDFFEGSLIFDGEAEIQTPESKATHSDISFEDEITDKIIESSFDKMKSRNAPPTKTPASASLPSKSVPSTSTITPDLPPLHPIFVRAGYTFEEAKQIEETEVFKASKLKVTKMFESNQLDLGVLLSLTGRQFGLSALTSRTIIEHWTVHICGLISIAVLYCSMLFECRERSDCITIPNFRQEQMELLVENVGPYFVVFMIGQIIYFRYFLNEFYRRELSVLDPTSSKYWLSRATEDEIKERWLIVLHHFYPEQFKQHRLQQDRIKHRYELLPLQIGFHTVVNKPLFVVWFLFSALTWIAFGLLMLVTITALIFGEIAAMVVFFFFAFVLIGFIAS